MIPFSIQKAVEITNGRFYGPDALLQESFDSVSIDTRTMQPGALYVPVKGDVFDGHRFIPQAFEKGAKLTLSEIKTSYPHIRVANAVKAFQALAHAYRCQFDIPLVGITGSAGKTTTRGMVSNVLSTQYNTHSTTGNLNNQTGVPQVLFGLMPEHQCAVVEMGTNHFGEIDALAVMSDHHMILNALAAVAVGLALNVPTDRIQQGLAAFAPISGRMAIEKLDRFTLLNDVYNANPTSMEASLQVLSRASGRKVCILGDMLELGDQAPALHVRVAQEAVRLGIDVIVGVGPLFYEAVKGLGFLTQDELLQRLPDLLKTGDTILVKGSRGMHLENTVQRIRSL